MHEPQRDLPKAVLFSLSFIALVVAYSSLAIILAIPDDLKATFAYRAGQFLTFKVPYEDGELVRCYSLSSSPTAATTFMQKGQVSAIM